MSKGYVYVLSNEAMPGIVKIGMTTGSVEDRAQQLYQTGVPLPFKVEHEVMSPNCAAMESHAHGYFSHCRVSSSREFFRCSVHDVIKLLDDVLREQVEELIEEYLPGHILVEDPMFVDPSAICLIGDAIGRHPYEAASILTEMRAGDCIDLSPLVSRYDARVQAVRAEREEAQSSNSAGTEVMQ